MPTDADTLAEVTAILSRATSLPLADADSVGHAEFAAVRLRNLIAACDERNAIVEACLAAGLPRAGLAARLSAVLAAARAAVPYAAGVPGSPLRDILFALRDALAAADKAL